MAPHPVKEVDQERKEELMIAKQLRQSRVTILPRTLNSPNFLNTSPYSSKSPSPSPNSFKKKSYLDEELPSNWSLDQKDTCESKYEGPSKKDVEAASNPIALRYWNQCLSKAAHTKIDIPEITTQAPEVDTSWEDCPPWAVSHSDFLSPDEEYVGKESLLEKKCSMLVPDIKRHMKRLDVDRPSGTKQCSANLDSLVQRSSNISETTYELPTFEISVAHDDASVAHDDASVAHDDASVAHDDASPPVAHDDASPLVKRKHSICKQKITRINEVKEAAQNIGRFLTIDQIERSDKNKISTLASKDNGTIKSMHEDPSHHKASDMLHNKMENVAPPLPPKNSKLLNSSPEKAEIFETPPETRQNSPGEEYQKKLMSHSYEEVENIYDKEDSAETEKRLIGIPKTFGKDDIEIQLDETSDISALADMLLPQLNSKQKNHLGLVFFNQLSNNIVEDVLIQQLTVMSGTKLYNALKNVDKKVLEHVVPKLIPLSSKKIIAGVVTVLMNSLKVEEKAEKAEVVNCGGEEDVLEICTKLMSVIEKKKKHEFIKAAIKYEDDDDLIEELFKDYLKRKNINELNEAQIHSQDDIDEHNEVIEAKNIPTINIVDDEDKGNIDDIADNVTQIDREKGEDLQDIKYNKEIFVKEEFEKSDEESFEWEEEYDEEESYSVETVNGEFSVAFVN